MQVHGYLTESGEAGPLFHAYLDILKDKVPNKILSSPPLHSYYHGPLS